MWRPYRHARALTDVTRCCSLCLKPPSRRTRHRARAAYERSPQVGRPDIRLRSPPAICDDGGMSSRISDRIATISESATLAVDAKAKALKAAGRPVIGFGAGEPDF